MSIKRDAAEAKEAVPCELCFQKKGRNAKIVHVLNFADVDDLRRHLVGIYGQEGEKDGRIESEITFWRFVHKYYGEAAWNKYQPLWLTYLEAHGVTVRGRSEAIMKHRGRVYREPDARYEPN